MAFGLYSSPNRRGRPWFVCCCLLVPNQNHVSVCVFFQSARYFLFFWGQRAGFSEISISFSCLQQPQCQRKALLINSGPQNNLKPRLRKFIPRGSVCPTWSVHFSFNSLHSGATVQFFIFSGTENAARGSSRRLGQHQSGLRTHGSSSGIRVPRSLPGLQRARM